LLARDGAPLLRALNALAAAANSSISWRIVGDCATTGTRHEYVTRRQGSAYIV
jgi:hypothetical protein